MNPLAPMRCSRAAFAAALLGVVAVPAQTPVDAPPTWAIADDTTVSLYWSFDALPPLHLQPTFARVPPWFGTNPGPNNGISLSANVARVPVLTTHTGVLALTAPGSGSITVGVDNDPHQNWLKVFFVQFDAHESGSGDVKGRIVQMLGQYERASITVESVPIGGNWSRVTITAKLIPQPDYEDVQFDLAGAIGNDAAIDDLYVHSKCIEPPSDETGDALGTVDSTGPLFDLDAITGNAGCVAAAVTETPAGVRTYWVGAQARPGQTQHELLRISQGGALQATITLGTPTVAISPRGLTDLTVARLLAPTPITLVYGVSDERAAAGLVRLYAFDPATGTAVLPRMVTILGPAFPPSSDPRGLVFDPTGDLGAGSFWITDQNGVAREFDLAGAPLDSMANLPPGVTGAGYDPLTFQFYWFSRDPLGGLRVNGFEHDARTRRPTGVRFAGNLALPNPGPFQGGEALGCEVYRRRNGDFRAVCVVETPSRRVLYELKGPYRFGWNLLGTCGMSGGLPREGSLGFAVTLDGVPNALLASLRLGFSNTASGTTPLPFNLGFLGLAESNLSVSLDLSSPFLAPVAPGSFRFPIPLPGGFGLAGTPLFFQWVVLDPTAPQGLATSEAGKTLIY